jgi:hypothetical protein
MNFSLKKPALYGVHTSYLLGANRAYYWGMVAAGPCAELQELKRKYESALRAWGQYHFPPHNEPAGTRARRSEQLQRQQRALDARNEANDRVFDHKRICPLCTGKAETGQKRDAPWVNMRAI